MGIVLRRLVLGFVLATFLIGALIGPIVASAKEPSTGCALLPVSELQKVLGGSFGAPASSVATPAFAGLPPGTHCEYTAASGGGEVVFIVYVDPSAATAKDTFQKLVPYYSVTSSPPHLGDTAYIDRNNAIHVLQGKVRFYISVTPSPSGSKPLVDLATFVSKQL
jgi:hypothetical protein